MGRKYTHIKKIEVEIHEMRVAGKTRQEIADHFVNCTPKVGQCDSIKRLARIEF